MPPTPAVTSPGTSPPASAAEGGDHTEARRRLWLAALHQLALADGDFTAEEQAILAADLEQDLPGVGWEALHLPGAEALAHRFGPGSVLAEEFLGTAVLVALADGHISPIEMELLRHWSTVLAVGADRLADLRVDGASGGEGGSDPSLLERLRSWLDGIDPSDPAVARFLVRLIPGQCPFERDVMLFGHKLVHIPPMCTINPLYEQLVALRFRCLCRLEATGAQHPPALPCP